MERVLQQYFNYSHFRPGQKEVITSVVRGEDVIGLFPTSMGKSLCYEILPYIQQGRVLIISPLISLMEDQVRRIKQRGEKRVVALTSQLTHEERELVKSRLSHYRYIFCSPEMLMKSEFATALQSLSYSAITLDEAHCISQWGYDFRPEYLQVGEWIQKLANRPPILALTATAHEQTVQELQYWLNMRTPKIFRGEMNRSNLYYDVRKVTSPFDVLVRYIERELGDGIVYVRTRKKAELYAQYFIERGMAVASYHGGMDRQDRSLIQQQFLKGELDWVFATSAFGMGIDKPNIRHVIHESIPLSFEQYVQEVGRAGRDGQNARCLLLYNEADLEEARLFSNRYLLTNELFEEYNRYRSLDKSEVEIMKLLQIESSFMEIIKFYETHYSKEERAQLIHKNADDKKRQLELIFQWLTSDTCYRDTLLKYFHSEPVSQERCCSNCRFVEEQFEENSVTVCNSSWEERLQQLFE